MTEPFPYDRASKWLIGHHGDAILRLAGLTDIVEWRAIQAEVVQPRRLPDGLLEVRRTGRDQDDLFIVEIAADPERRLGEQLLRDISLVYLDRGVLPEAVVVVLRRKGRLKAAGSVDLRSPAGLSRLRASWRVVELWRLSAADLLATQEPGLAPWAVAARWDGPPEVLLQQCREVIVQKARPDELLNMLVVAIKLAGIRYNDDRRLLDILGGKEVMIESALEREIIAEQTALRLHKIIVDLLADRLGPVPPDVEASIHTSQDEQRLSRINRLAARAADYESFRRELNSLLTQLPEGEA